MKNLFLVSLFCCLSPLWLNAQTKVTGKVTDLETGETLIGATVTEKGTSNVAVTNADGVYQIVLTQNSNAVLVVTYLGYTMKEVAVENQTTLDIQMSTSTELLGEVVVTALGQRRELKSLGYAISTLKGEDIVKSGATVNPFTSLYGKAAGVGIQQGAAGPTGSVNIKIRGANRLDPNSSTRPLFVVDGVPIRDNASSMATRGYDPMNSFDYGTGINDLNAEDIESMEILKGAKASVLYGSEGANGVVLITTKKGVGTRGLGVTISYQASYEQPVSFIDFQNEYGSGTNEYSLLGNLNDPNDDNILINSGYNFGTKFDNREITYWDGSKRKYQAYKDNYMDIFSPGSTSNLQVAIAGGNEKGNMRLAYTDYNYNGVMENNWQKKDAFSFSGKMDASKFASFEVIANLMNISTHNRQPNIGGLVSGGTNRDYDYDTMARMYLDDDGYSRRNLEEYNLPAFQTNIANILWQQNQNSNLDKKLHLISSIKATFKFHPAVFLTTSAGLDYTQIDFTREDQVTAVKPKTTGGMYKFETQQAQAQIFNGFLNFDKSFMNDKLRVTALGGGEYKSTSDYNIYTSTFGDLSYPDWYSLNNAPGWPSSAERSKVLGNSRGSDIKYSIIGSATISWKEKYWLELNARNDWSSLLPPENNSYFYPGASFTWGFTEDFKIPSLEYGKLRLGWADAGSPGSVRYFAINSYDVSTIANTNGAQVVTPPSSLFSGTLKPERKREFELGTNLKFFPGNRLEIDFSYYTGHVYDQIMSVPLSTTTGYATIKMNAGDVKNWGWDLFIKGTILNTDDDKLRWDATFTVSNYKTKVEKLYEGITRQVIASDNGWQVVATEGQESGDLLTYDYKKTADGQRIVNSNGLYSLDYQKGFQKTANVNPDFLGGFSTDFYYKNFRASVGFDYSYGSSIVSMSNYYLVGRGQTKETLQGRDEAHGGITYYLGENDVKVPLNGGSAPTGELVYHDGIILPGMKEVAGGGYVPNDQIVSAYEYWQTFIHDLNGDLQPDYIFENNYVKLREVSFAYTVPKHISEKLKLQKLSFSVYGRNLLYLYKSIPNIDSESVLGMSTAADHKAAYVEYSAFPSLRSFGFGVNVSF